MRPRLLRKPAEWGIEPVPPEKRNLRAVDLGVLWFNLAVGLLVLYAGTYISFYGFGLVPLVLIALAGSILGSVLLAGAGTIGSRYGVPTMVSLRPIFGSRGSFVPTVLNAAQLFGWTALEVWVMSVAATALSGPILGPATGIMWVAIFGVFCGLLAWGGPLVVVREWLERVGLWLVLGSAGWMSVRLATEPGLVAALPLWGGDWSKFGLGLDLVVAMPISWWPLVSDYSRFAHSTRRGFAGTTLGYAAGNTWFYVLGAVMVLAFSLRDPMDVFSTAIVGVFGPLVLLAILADETDNGFADIYSTSVSIQNVRPRARLSKLIPIVTGTGLAAAAFLTSLSREAVLYYESFLLGIGGVFVPMLGVVLADAFVVRRAGYGKEEFAEGASKVRWPAFLAWALGMLAYFPIVLVNAYGMSIDLGGVNLIGASLPAFATAGIVYVAASRLRSPAGERAPT